MHRRGERVAIKQSRERAQRLLSRRLVAIVDRLQEGLGFVLDLGAAPTIAGGAIGALADSFLRGFGIGHLGSSVDGAAPRWGRRAGTPKYARFPGIPQEHSTTRLDATAAVEDDIPSMAIRSGSTGPLVSLVVFVILTVLSLVGAIYFYSEADKAQTERTTAMRELAKVINDEQRGREVVQSLDSAAQAQGQTLIEHMLAREASMATLVSGDAAADTNSVRASLRLADGQSAKQALDEARRAAAESESKFADQVKASEAISAQADAARAEAEAANKSAEEKIAQLTATIAPYRESSERAMAEIAELKNELIQAREQAQSEYANQLAEEQSKQAALVAANQNLSERVQVLQTQLEQFRIKPSDASLLADGKVVDIGTSKDQVFISLGLRDHVRPGMTFEVYPDAAAILYDPKTDRQSPGKASIEVVKVGDTTSTARVTRQRKGQSIQRDDVLANAVYSPSYKYKFLVHGNFDVDADGKSGQTEADYIRGRIQEWGGVVIDGDELTPDVDFVVVGTPPSRVMAKPLGEDSAGYNAYLESKRAYDAYEALVASARGAQVPVLNWNRFQILTGAAER